MIVALPIQQDPQTMVQNALETLAQRVSKTDTKAALRLRKLKEALGDAMQAETWADANLESVINPSAIVERYRRQVDAGHLIGVLEWFRNILIFVPLTLTWLGISAAVIGYGDLLGADNTQTSQPFLYLWQQNFNGHLPFWGLPLGRLALYDFFFLCGILLLTGFINFKSHIIHVTRDKDVEALRGDLVDALANASLLLQERKPRVVHRLASVTAKMDEISTKLDKLDIIAARLGKLDDVATKFGQAAEQFERISQKFLTELEEERNRLGDLTAFIDSLRQITKEMLTAVGKIERTNDKLVKSMDALITPVKEIPQRQEELIRAAQDAFSQLQSVVTSVNSVVSDLAQWRRELQDVLETSLSKLIAEQASAGKDLHQMLDSSLTRLAEEQDRRGLQLYDLLDRSLGQLTREQEVQGQNLQKVLYDSLSLLAVEQNKVGQQLHDMLNTSLKQLSDQQGEWGRKFLEAVDSLDITVEQFGKFVGSIEHATKQQSQFFKALENERNEQTKLTQLMSGTSRDIEQALKAVRDWTPELRSMSVDMEKLVFELKGLPDTLKKELFEPLKHYSSAAATISLGVDTLKEAGDKVLIGANTLQVAAGAINQASAELTNAAAKLDKNNGNNDNNKFTGDDGDNGMDGTTLKRRN